MFASIFALLALAAQAYDDASLMQHGVGVTSKESVQASLAVIKQGLAEIPKPGKMRQMAIDALMKSVSDADKIDESAKGTLREIDNLLKSILDELEAENDADQHTLDSFPTRMSTCNAETSAADATAESNWNDALAAHNSCRATERDLFDAEVSKCNHLTQLMGAYSSTEHCGTPIKDDTLPFSDTYLTEWESWISDGLAWISGRISEFETHNQNCKGAMNELAGQKTTCNGDQRNAELKFCLWHMARITFCTTREECYEQASEEHVNATRDIKPVADQRVNEARLIEHVQCLINQLIEGLEISVANCRAETDAHEDLYQSTYNVTYPAIPDLLPCTDGEVACYPSGSDDNPACPAGGWKAFAWPEWTAAYDVQSPLNTDHANCSDVGA